MTMTLNETVNIFTHTDGELRQDQYDNVQFEGTMNVTSGAVTVSDPCYGTDVWCMFEKVELDNGTYNCFSLPYKEEGRISAIMIIKDNVEVGQHYLTFGEDLGTAGVDSGQLGFFDKDKYRKGATEEHFSLYEGKDFPCESWLRTWEEYKDESDEEKFYNAVSNCSLTNHGCGVIEELGFNSSSGFGDGSYPVVELLDLAGNRVGLRVDFIVDNDYFIEDDYEY